MSKISFNERVILVDILAILFGISSWVEINGLWVQTPILVNKLPESWNLASFIVIIIQLANIGPILYSILKFKFSLKYVEKPAIHVTLAIGTIACLLLSLFWDSITDINGSKHSIAFLTLIGLLAFVDCTTSVLYLPFMAHFKSKYLMSYLIGQGLSGLIPSVVAIIQGIGGNPECVNVTSSTTNTTKTEAIYPEPRFSVGVFFIFLMIMVLMSWIAFIFLNNLKSVKSQLVNNFKDSDREQTQSNEHNEHLDTTHVKDIPSVTSKLDSESSLMKNSIENVSKPVFIALLLSQAYICMFTNGVLPAIQTYSCLPYGNTTYHLTVTLSSIANPIACFLAFYINSSRIKRMLPLIIGFGTVCVIYIISTAVLSPKPPLYDSVIGKVIITVTWIAFTSFFSFSRACIASIMRNTSTGHKSLFFCGVFTQIGSAFGAIVMFLLVNYADIFVAFMPCN